MKIFFHSHIAVSLFTALFLLFPVTVFSAKSPIHIEADHMTSTEKSSSVVFTGDVDAKQGDVRIRADKMTVYYTRADKKKKKNSPKMAQQVEKLICTGNVEVTRGDWLGTGKKMIYLSKERQVILVDNAKAWQGQNMVSGSKIIYYLDEGRSEVIGRVGTTVSKSGRKKKKARVNMTIIQK
ncbi:lipopolysaccharide transport periplasmic protein LptA [Desulfomarina sp.]